jgi:hypothetical protein
MTQTAGLIWFSLTLLPLVYLQRLLHREIQAVILMLTRDVSLTMGVFAVLFFPGVLLHELSHFIFAKILFVPVGRVSLIPQSTRDGRLQLGFVETLRTDMLRDSLIGASPLFVGGLALAFISINRMGLVPLWEVLRNGQYELFWLGVTYIPQVKDFYLWFYLTFTISSTMLPSDSDRQAWFPLSFALGVLVVVAIFAGAGPWMLDNLAPLLNDFLIASALLFALSIVVHIILLFPFYIVRISLMRILGLDVL